MQLCLFLVVHFVAQKKCGKQLGVADIRALRYLRDAAGLEMTAPARALVDDYLDESSYTPDGTEEEDEENEPGANPAGSRGDRHNDGRLPKENVERDIQGGLESDQGQNAALLPEGAVAFGKGDAVIYNGVSAKIVYVNRKGGQPTGVYTIRAHKGPTRKVRHTDLSAVEQQEESKGEPGHGDSAWQMCFDDGYQRPFWYNSATHQRSWSRPEGYRPPTAAQPDGSPPPKRARPNPGDNTQPQQLQQQQQQQLQQREQPAAALIARQKC